MRVEVQTTYENGRELPKRERVLRPKFRGNLHVREARVQSLGRIATTADLSSVTDANEQLLLPTLLDARVLFLHDGQMRIRGVESIQGAQYGQTWDVKVLPC